MKIIGRNWISPPPGPGCGAAWNTSSSLVVISRGSYPSASRLGERQRALPRRHRRPGGGRSLPHREEVLPENAPDDGLGVPPPQELLGQDRELRDVFEPHRGVFDPVEVGAEAGGAGPADLQDPLDVVDDGPPGGSPRRYRIQEVVRLPEAALRVVLVLLRDLGELRREL